MQPIDEFRINRVKQAMRQEGLDVLVCRLPEHVLYLSGYWPVIGASLAVFDRDGETTLITPWSELDYTETSWVKDIRTYRFIRMDAMADPSREMAPVLAEVWKQKQYGPAVAGYEGSFELVAANNVSAEARVVTESTIRMFRETVPEVTWKDASRTLRRARLVKSPIEIRTLEVCNEVAAMGYRAAAELIRAGVTEAEVSAAVEQRIYGKGVGYKGVKRTRGYCFAMSGANSANSWRPFCISTNKPLAEGEPVLVELDAFTDGYFNDLTRTFVVGEPTDKARKIFTAVKEAVNHVTRSVRPGVRARDLDALSREVLTEHGYGEFFIHQLGHGIGLQFHEPPTLHPASDDVLEEGMVFAIEPGVYIPGWGGVRIEENLVVTADGYKSLCPFPQWSQE